MNNNKEILIKRLLYRSKYRGCKETDYILGKFATDYLHQLSYEELLNYQQILEANDWDIYNWVTKKVSVPENLDNSVMQKLLQMV
jgi:succinate dehydrogenase flavin-adding protein (antitoxin of CptAB toxin-antitoxin module)